MSFTPNTEQQELKCPEESVEERIREINSLEERLKLVENIFDNVSRELKNVNLDFEETWAKVNKLQEIMILQQSIILLLLKITRDYYRDFHLSESNKKNFDDKCNYFNRIGNSIYDVNRYMDTRLDELHKISSNRSSTFQEHEDQTSNSHLQDLSAEKNMTQTNSNCSRTFDTTKCLLRSNTEPRNEPSNMKDTLDLRTSSNIDSHRYCSPSTLDEKSKQSIEIQFQMIKDVKKKCQTNPFLENSDNDESSQKDDTVKIGVPKDQMEKVESIKIPIINAEVTVVPSDPSHMHQTIKDLIEKTNNEIQNEIKYLSTLKPNETADTHSSLDYIDFELSLSNIPASTHSTNPFIHSSGSKENINHPYKMPNSSTYETDLQNLKDLKEKVESHPSRKLLVSPVKSSRLSPTRTEIKTSPTSHNRTSPSRLERSSLRYDQELAQLERLEMKLAESKYLASGQAHLNQNMYSEYFDKYANSQSSLLSNPESHFDHEISPSRFESYDPEEHKIDPKDVDNQLRELYADSELDRLNMRESTLSFDDIMANGGFNDFNNTFTYQNNIFNNQDVLPDYAGACSLNFTEEMEPPSNLYYHNQPVMEHFGPSEHEFTEDEYLYQTHFHNSISDIPYHQSYRTPHSYASSADPLSSRNVPLLPDVYYTSYPDSYQYNSSSYLTHPLTVADTFHENEYESLDFQEPSESPPPPAPDDSTYLNPLYVPEVAYRTYKDVSQGMGSAKISPKTPRKSLKKSATHNITAVSDSSLSSMSGWSGFEKSPIPPRRQQSHAKTTTGSIYSNNFNKQSIIFEAECEDYSQEPLYNEFDVLQDENDYSANYLLPGGHRTSAFTPVRTPTFGSVQLTNTDNGNGFVPPPAPNGYKPKRKKDHQKYSSNTSDYNLAIYSEAAIGSQDCEVKYSTSSNVKQSPVPDILGQQSTVDDNDCSNDEQYLDKKSWSDSSDHEDKVRRKFKRGVPAYSSNHSENSYNTGSRGNYKGRSITDALSYYPSSPKVSEVYSGSQSNQSEPVYDRPRLLNYQQNTSHIQHNKNITPQAQYIRSQQYSGPYNNQTEGVIVSQLGYISISNDHKEKVVKTHKSPTKKSKAILKSAMSFAEQVSSSVSSILPIVRFTKRKRSSSLPGTPQNDFPITKKEPKRSGLAKFKSLSLSPSRAVDRKKCKSETKSKVMSSFGTFLKKYNKKRNKNSNGATYMSDPESEWGTHEKLGSTEDSDSVFSDSSPKNSRKTQSHFKNGQRSMRFKPEQDHGSHFRHDTLPTDIQFNFQSGNNGSEIPLSEYQKQICLQKQHQNFLPEAERKVFQEQKEPEQEYKKEEDGMKLLGDKYSYSRRVSYVEDEDTGIYETLAHCEEQIPINISHTQNHKMSVDGNKDYEYFEFEDSEDANDAFNTTFQNTRNEFAMCATKPTSSCIRNKKKANEGIESDMQRRLSKEINEAEYHPNMKPYQSNGNDQVAPGHFNNTPKSEQSQDNIFFSDFPVFATVGDLKKCISMDSGSEENGFSSTVTIGNASREFAVSRALGKYRQRKSSSASENGEKLTSQVKSVDKIEGQIQVITTDEEEEEMRRNEIFEKINYEENNKKSELTEEVTLSNFETSPMNSRVRPLPPRHQQSLEIPCVGRPGETEEDSKSTHSWRSTSRVSSRRQSTEDSIDSEDEWYIYELRKLEELERLGIQQLEYQPVTEKNLETLKDFRQNKSNDRQYEAEHGLGTSEDNGHEHVSFEEQDSEVLTSKLDEPRRSPEYDEDIDEEEDIGEEEERKGGSGSGETSGPDSPHEEEEYEDFNEGRRDGEQKDELKPEDIVPGIPSIPRFKFDSSKVNYDFEKDLPKDKEDAGVAGGPLGSKWKLVKALKERKAEEKVAAETPTPEVKVSYTLYYIGTYFKLNAYECCVFIVFL